MPEIRYKRVLLKLSGEALAPADGMGIDPPSAKMIAEQVKSVYDMGADLAIVIGGGNIWRGKIGLELGMDRATADYMGMLATVMNCLALCDVLEQKGVPARVMTALEMPAMGELYTHERAMKHLQSGKVVLFGGGTGHPFFSTDTGTVLRAAEIGADVILLAKNVDGVYSADPLKDSSAVKYDEISYGEVLAKKLGVMDLTATSLAMDNHIPVYVFALRDPENILRVVAGENVGTLVH